MHEHVKVFNTETSRVRGVHFQGIQGSSPSRLLQALDNVANEHLGHARRVQIYEKLTRKFAVETVKDQLNFALRGQIFRPDRPGQAARYLHYVTTNRGWKSEYGKEELGKRNKSNC